MPRSFNKALIVIFSIFFISFSSALIITEVELNPLGDDAGNEWVEFYSEDLVNLESYKIVNNDGNEIFLNGSFTGYFVYEFEKQWLDNSDEKVFLYSSSELIQETDIFQDSTNDEKSFNFCSEEWIFINSTRNQENKCSNEEPFNEEEQEISEDEDEEEIENINEEDIEDNSNLTKNVIKDNSISLSSNEISELNSNNQTIQLNPKNIKTDENTDLSKRDYS